VRVLVDYRSALRERSGVGEYTHQLVRALLDLAGAECPLDLTLFSSSWKDRLDTAPFRSAPNGADEPAGVNAIDRAIPGRVLNLAWHRLEWPPIELVTGAAFDVVHALHPLMIPSRRAAQVITIHDLDFLSHPERTRAEIRRDYPALAPLHARRAHAIVVVSQYTAREVQRRFDVPADAITVCRPGAPDWRPRSRSPEDGYLLFMGTLEPRKNVGGLLDAYERLLARRGTLPKLVIAGKALPESAALLERVGRPPLHGTVEHIGYVEPPARRAVYEGARILVHPAFEEGFGMTVLEAMTLGIPVVAADRGALPEVVGDAGPLVNPDDPEQIARAIDRLLADPMLAAANAQKGVLRSASFRWDAAARSVCEAYRHAIERRCASA
jgi:glycosyltransferase involved in cell wall biosynthesis